MGCGSLSRTSLRNLIVSCWRRFFLSNSCMKVVSCVESGLFDRITVVIEVLLFLLDSPAMTNRDF